MTGWCLHFEQFHLFRRIVILIELAMLLYVTELSFQYILVATAAAVPGDEIVMVVGSLQAPFALLLGYSFKVYAKQRSLDKCQKES